MKHSLQFWLGLVMILPTVLSVPASAQQFESHHFVTPPAFQLGFFGKKVAIDPPWAVLSDPTGHPSGVLLYRISPTGWHHTQTIVELVDYIGAALAIDQDTLIVAAPEWDYFGERRGKVFIYERDGLQWRLSQELQPDGLPYWSVFGTSVAIDDNLLAIGASNLDSPSLPGQGAVFIYEKRDSAWELEARFIYEGTRPEILPYALLGASVAVSGDTVVASALAVDNYTGVAWVFERRASGWLHTAVLEDPTPAEADIFGSSVAIHGDTIVIGEKAGGASGPLLGSKKGSAFIFERSSSGDWVLMQEIEPSDGWSGSSLSDRFGDSVAIDGDRVVVAAPYGLTEGTHDGAIYYYEPDVTGAWPHHETGRLWISGATTTPVPRALGFTDVDIRDGFVLGAAGITTSAYAFELGIGDPFCTGSSDAAQLTAVGGPGSAAIVLSVQDAAPDAMGVFLASPNRALRVFQRETFCLGSGLVRLGPTSHAGGSGTAMHELDLGALPGVLSAGTWYFQYWHRDQLAPGGFRFSNAVALQALPPL